MLEEERKYDADAQFAMPELAACLPAGGQVRERPVVTLRATYYDTSDLRLARAGVSLRHRRGEDGAPWTVKLPTSTPGTRREISVPGASGTPPQKLITLVTAYTRGAPVAPRVALRTVRAAYDLVDADGAVLAQVVDDAVTVLDGRKVRSRFREIEVERKSGSRKLLDHVEKTLLAAGATTSTFVPKHVRALGESATAPPDVPRVTSLPRRPTAADVVAAALRHDIDRIVTHDPLVRLRAEVGDGDTAVHQMRVGCRRLRSDLRTFAALLDASWATRLRDELRAVADALGVARDAEVLRARLRRTATADPLAPLDEAALSHVDAVLVSRQEAALEAVDAVLTTDRYHVLLDELAAAARQPRLTIAAVEPARDVLPRLVARPWRRLAQAVTTLSPDDPDEAWHAVRIRAKRARYAAEAAATVAKPARDLAKAIAQVQDLLGEHQDAVVASQTWLAIADAARDDHALAVTVGRLVERERQAVRKVRAALPAAWRRASRRKLTEWLP